MKEQYIDILKEYGLTDNEVQIYIALLKLGSATAQETAHQAGLARTTTYHLLESLRIKGLVGSVEKGAITYFQASKPERIVKILDERKKRIKSIIPELTSLASTITEKPKVIVFEGTKGIKTILQEVLEEKKEILHYGDLSSLNKALPFIFPQFISSRVEKRIPIRLIGKQEKEHAGLLKTAKKEYRSFVFIPKEFEFKMSGFIYKNKVALLSLQKEPYYAIVISNKDFYDTQRNMFELLWKAYKK